MHKLCVNQVDYSIDRMHYLCAEGRLEDSYALYEEIQDWLVEKIDVEVISLNYIGDYLTNLDNS